MTGISVLVCNDNSNGFAYEFRTINASIAALAELTEGQYVDAVTTGDWAVYFNEDTRQGRPNEAADSLISHLAPGTVVRPMSGRCVFLGVRNGVETDVPDRLIDLALANLPEQPHTRVCLFRHRKHLFVYDNQNQAVKDLLGLITRHRDAHDLDPIEAFFGVMPHAWVELRVEIMDDWSIQLHDHRNDRTYG